MNLRFTFSKHKAAHLNIDPINAWITNIKHRSNLLLNPIIAGVLIINDKDEFEPVLMPTSMTEPDKAFDMASIWGNSLSGAAFVAVDSSELTGLVIGIISKANAIKHKFIFLTKTLAKNFQIASSQPTSSRCQTFQVIYPISQNLRMKTFQS
jgi:hypothetical protein